MRGEKDNISRGRLVINFPNIKNIQELGVFSYRTIQSAKC